MIGNNLQGRRRLLQGGPANNQGIATWTYSYGESVGLQYDPFALAGSVAAAPPLAANAQGKPLPEENGNAFAACQTYQTSRSFERESDQSDRLVRSIFVYAAQSIERNAN